MKSIFRMLVTSFIVLMIVLLVSLGGFFTLSKLQKHAHRQFRESNRETSLIATSVSQMNALATNMLRSSSSDLVASYQKKIFELDEQIAEVRTNEALQNESREILRRLYNFNRYQDTLLRDSQNLKYDILTYIRDSMSFHQMAIEELVSNNYAITSSLYQAFEKKLSSFEYTLWIFLITFILGFCIVGIRTARTVFHQIDEMHNYALQLSQKNWTLADISVSGFQELDDLSLAMNKMKLEILLYIDQIKEKARLEKILSEKLIEAETKDKLLLQAQLTNMRSQINPHFLFNALDLIGKVAYLNNPELAMELIEAISKILRYSLDATDSLVPLEKELDIVKLYVFLQTTRFGERITVDIRMQEEARTWPVPSMLIQPLIENCFTHGIGSKTHLAIVLIGEVKNDKLQISIEDDGIGFDPALRLKGTKQHIGLSNVETRLKIRYKQENLFSIESKIGMYTRISLTIPSRESIV